MRRILIAIFVLTFLFSGAAVYASNDIKVVINGETQSYDNDQPPVIKNNRTLVPMRGIFEALGAEVYWYADTQTVVAIKGKTFIELQIGSYIAYVNGEQVILDQPAEVINGRTMVQIRFVSEALGAKVDWEGATNTVIITSNEEEKSVSEINNSIVNISGVVIDPQSKWVWFLIKKDGTNDAKDVIIPVESNQFSYDLYLSMGAGEYTIYVYENTEQYGYYTLNSKFNVTNLDTRDPHLLPSERIESEDPRIVELANQITEGYDTDIDKSRAIYGWVIKNIKYDATSYLNGEDVSHSALEVLEIGITDCDGYARLTAALHRAVGIEAKVVIGDTDGVVQFDGVVDHAWNEVFIDGEWIILDPTWGAGYINPRNGIFVSRINFDYYNPTDDFFAKTHIKMGELYE